MKYTKNKIKKAGKELLINSNNETSLEILSYWREQHTKPLDDAVKLLKSIAKEFDKSSFIGKRLKRTESIINKLNRFENMRLTTMNDIGGCRIILSNMKKVRKLVSFLIKDKKFEIRKDYIKFPKKDGYKSIHLIGKFKNEKNEKFPIELQIRTKVQHAWATAVEIVDLFTNQSIKTNTGKEEWKEFFKQASFHLGLIDEDIQFTYTFGKNRIDNSNKLLLNYINNFKKLEDKNKNKKIYKLYKSYNSLEINYKFDLFKQSIRNLNDLIEKLEKKIKGVNSAYALISIQKIEIDKKKAEFEIEVNIYENTHEANREYLKKEKMILTSCSYLTALVSTESLKELKLGYPNYFADSTDFLNFLNVINKAYIKMNPGIFNLVNKVKYLFAS
ncbi:hypothetical protein [Malaciobacter marinus]|uniref:hypothetical protein n=1 Tax=Malaciobacter marinus TaxID=505249 RepID=UPI003B0051D6